MDSPSLTNALRLAKQEWTEPYRTALHNLVDTSYWYAKCLDDMREGHPVRNLDEAKLGYERAVEKAHRLIEPENVAAAGA